MITSPRPPAFVSHLSFSLIIIAASALLHASPSGAQSSWDGFAASPQHTAVSGVASQALDRIAWQTPVDLIPQYFGGALLVHYGSPLVSAANTVVIPVKTGASDGFRVEARSGDDGGLRWQFDSDYTLPTHNWIPSFGPVLTPAGRLYLPGAGGTLFAIDDVDGAGPPVPIRIVFYGAASYDMNPGAFNASIQVCTPLTSDAQGNVYFGYRATGSNPLNLKSGFVRIGADGSSHHVTATAATGGAATVVTMNSACALSNDGATVYVAMTRQTGDSRGNLVALDATSLATLHSVQLKDPKSGKTATIDDDGTASPMVGPDGKVYFGIVENPFPSNGARGWLLQLGANLALSGAPAAFGWDDTPSLVPASAVPSYHGASTYLLMVKYNNYADDSGGDGVNKLAILDPNATQVDSRTGTTVMKEILTIAGVTPDSSLIGTYPNAVEEWCINTAAFDPFTGSVLANSEDGKLYRWDLATNTFTDSITLTAGLGEAYTPTAIGHDGKVYAINNATLFAIGATAAAVTDGDGSRTELRLALARPNPFTHATALRFALPQAGRVRLEVLDVTGRHVVTLVDGVLAAGEHAARWDGRDARGRRMASGIYLARLVARQGTATRKLILTDS